MLKHISHVFTTNNNNNKKVTVYIPYDILQLLQLLHSFTQNCQIPSRNDCQSYVAIFSIKINRNVLQLFIPLPKPEQKQKMIPFLNEI